MSFCKSMLNSFLLISGFCLIITTTGCDSAPKIDRGAIKGEVLLDGEPISQGRIVFEPAGGNKGPSAGSSITNGKFEISEEKGAVLGKNVVRINATKSSGKKVKSSMSDEMIDELVEAVPEKYNKNTTLEKEISSGENEFKFELTTK